MISKNNILEQLDSDIKDIEDMIKNRKKHNLKSYIVKPLIKSGIAIEYALPFILSGTILFYGFSNNNNTPFKKDKVIEKFKYEKMLLSTGYEKNMEYDNIDNVSFKHTTGWKMDESGMFERVETTYHIKSTVDKNNIKELLKLSKEEVDKKFIIKSVETIKKDTLDNNDACYYADTLIISNYVETNGNIKIETIDNNVTSTFIYIILCYILGCTLAKLKDAIIKTSVYDKLMEVDSRYIIITKKELEDLNKILNVKKENLELLGYVETDHNKEQNKEYAYKLKGV